MFSGNFKRNTKYTQGVYKTSAFLQRSNRRPKNKQFSVK